MKPVVLVQLSDIHFTGGNDTEAARHESIRLDLNRDLKSMRDVVGDASTIVVTGDIAYSGQPAEYDVAGKWLDQVVGVVGTEPAKILTVPGNHDVDCTKVGDSAALAHNMLRECAADELDSKLRSFLKDPARPLTGKLDNYNSFAARYDCITPEDGRAWETSFPLGRGYKLAVRGLCSVFNSDRQDRQRLMVGRGQSTLSADEGKIYLLLAHHGPGDLRDGDTLRDTIKGRAVALLTGHRHDQRIRDVDGCVEVSAGAVNLEEETGWYPSYNWLRIGLIEGEEPPRLKIDVWHRQWRPEWNGFGSGSRDGGSESWTPRIPDHALLATADASPERTAELKATSDVMETGGPDASTGAPTKTSVSQEGHEATDSAADLRPAMEDADGHVSLERRVRHALFELRPLSQVNILTDCGVLQDSDWAKPFVLMIGDALSVAANEGILERVEEAVQRASATEGQ